MTTSVLLAALTLAPWLHPLAFRPLPGWQTGASGDTRSVYVGRGRHVVAPEESAAWIARGVRYRDPATADPPNATLAHLPRDGVVVWAVIYAPVDRGQRPIHLDLARARHLPCCDGVGVVGGEDELTGSAGRGSLLGDRARLLRLAADARGPGQSAAGAQPTRTAAGEVEGARSQMPVR